MSRAIKITLALTVLALILCEYVLFRECVVARKLYANLISFQWTAMIAVAVCLCGLILLDFSIADLPLAVLLLIAIASPLLFQDHRIGLNAVIFVFGAAMGKTIKILLRKRAWRQREDLSPGAQINTPSNNRLTTALLRSRGDIYYFLAGVSVLLAIASFCQVHLPNAFYNGPRWMGIWDNPNEYGMLMGAGVILAVGLLATPRHEEGKRKNWLTIILFIATGIMAVGLLFSYSRGAWLGSAIGLTYLAKLHGKLNWRYTLPFVIGMGVLVWMFWNGTADSAPWYLKRMDLGRPSAQHRVAAWKAGLKIMRDHPFGVGWNKSIEIYFANYSPPRGGAGAIATDDYLMLGTQLGFPGLLCFLAYVATCFAGPKAGSAKKEVHSASKMSKVKSAAGSKIGISTQDGCQLACRAGALLMLVAFWFDDGLFNLATAAVFWTLLELGRADRVPISGNFRPAAEAHHREVASAA